VTLIPSKEERQKARPAAEAQGAVYIGTGVLTVVFTLVIVFIAVLDAPSIVR